MRGIKTSWRRRLANPFDWFLNDFYDVPKYLNNFQMKIDDYDKKRLYQLWKKAYDIALGPNTKFKSDPSSDNILDTFRIRTFPVEVYIDDCDCDYNLFRNKMRPQKNQLANYIRPMMYYGPWEDGVGIGGNFDQIEYLINILAGDKPNNPYTVICTSYLPWLYSPWIKNASKPPLRGGTTHCVWNIRPIHEDGKLSWYVSWRQSRLSYLLGNIYGLTDLFNMIREEVCKRSGKLYHHGNFYGHIISRENDLKKKEWTKLKTVARELLDGEWNA